MKEGRYSYLSLTFSTKTNHKFVLNGKYKSSSVTSSSKGDEFLASSVNDGSRGKILSIRCTEFQRAKEYLRIFIRRETSVPVSSTGDDVDTAATERNDRMTN